MGAERWREGVASLLRPGSVDGRRTQCRRVCNRGVVVEEEEGLWKRGYQCGEWSRRGGAP